MNIVVTVLQAPSCSYRSDSMPPCRWTSSSTTCHTRRGCALIYMMVSYITCVCHGPCVNSVLQSRLTAYLLLLLLLLPAAAAEAVMRAVSDPSIQDKSRLQMRVNFPEVGASNRSSSDCFAASAPIAAVITCTMLLLCTQVNPAFDTYRIGTLLEMVRTIALRLAEQRGLRVRVCVQQSLGEGHHLDAVQ